MSGVKPRKLRTDLIAFAVLIAMLSVLFAWTYTDLQRQISALSSEKSDLQAELDDLHASYQILNGTYQDYVSTHTHLDTEYDSLQDEYDSYRSTHAYLDIEYNSLFSEYQNYRASHSYSNADYSQLQSTYETYVSTHHYTDSQYNSIQSEAENLKSPQLHQVNVVWSDNHPLLGSPYVRIQGSIFNSGTYGASDVRYTIGIYDSTGTLLKSEQITWSNIQGKSYVNFDVSIGYNGDASYITTTLSSG